jgi:hypothetical protein
LPFVALAEWGIRPADFAAAAGVVAALIAAAALTRSQWVRTVARNRSSAWIGLAGLGLFVVVGAYVRYDRAMDAAEKAWMAEVTEEILQPSLKTVDVHATTDRGQAVTISALAEVYPIEKIAVKEERELTNTQLMLNVIRISPPDEATNCHGWVFAGGRHWIGGKQVEPILADNGYQVVSKPAVGDLVVYRDAEGNIAHSAVVKATPEGLPVLLESKWGCLGTFLHAPEHSPYGEKFTFYRSARTGHTLAGLASHPAEVKAD